MDTFQKKTGRGALICPEITLFTMFTGSITVTSKCNINTSGKYDLYKKKANFCLMQQLNKLQWESERT